MLIATSFSPMPPVHLLPAPVAPLEEQRQAYDTVARAIRFVRAHVDAQPSLDDVAAHVGLSPAHLQRLFSSWAGVSPKRFLQALTLERAARALDDGASVLDAALDAGLSGPGRLHDLVVSCEAVTPAELASGGAGVDVAWGVCDTPFGRACLGTTARGLCHLQFVDDDSVDVDATLRAAWPAARRARDDAQAATVAATIFGRGDRGVVGGGAPLPVLHVLLKGTNFQLQVWRALLAIPSGTTTSYGALAAQLGRPQAARAIGTAVGKNDIALVIPCHRVLREGGALGGYRWGLDRKAAVLAWEAARR